MIKLTFLTLAAVLATGAAQAATLTFDSIDGFNVGPQAVTTFDADGITGTISAVTDTGAATSAIIFDSATFSGNDNDLVAPFFLTEADRTAGTNGLSATEAGGLLVIAEDGSDFSNPNDRGNGGSITINFDVLVDFSGFRVFDDVTGFVVESNDGQQSAPVTLGFDNAYAVVDTNFTNVSSLTFLFGDSSGGIDNLTFTQVAAVPLPASLPLLLAGFGALGLAKRRKQRS